ncbi:MAG TPA: hypothetical protein VGK77_16810, partial [Candidatus Binatia bacterium]
SKTYNGEVRSSEKDFETLQLGAFATPGLLLAQGPVDLTAESGFSPTPFYFSICRIIVLEFDCSQVLGIKRYSLGHT